MTTGGSAGAVAGGGGAGAGGSAGIAGGGGAGNAGAGGGTAGKGGDGSAGSAGAAAGNAGTGGGSAGFSGAGQGGTGGETTDCPKGPGPAMVLIDVPGAAAYCIDSTEVTQAQYAAFLTTKPDVAKQSREFCQKMNYAFEPPVFQEGLPGGCPEGTFAPDKNPDAAVTCVNWCDAIAYCEWAGKRLCGKIGGGPSAGLKYGLGNQRDFACSQGGKTKYAYGNDFKDGVCTSADPGALGALTKPVGQGDCHGQAPPFSALDRLSGGVLEWLDACEESAPNECRLAGGATDSSTPAETACDHGGQAPATIDLPGAGFRCCAD
ncbi:MAG: SUMF1/EgtB/PvdO family nonheme iron enzyme [Polyangiaceae bacterium]|nr:SUMF1/EgtB/PvdO family nonheme iron enzyme [Polyangiaceae bacterium]